MNTTDRDTTRSTEAAHRRTDMHVAQSAVRTAWMLPILVSMFAALSIVGVHFTSIDVGAGHRMLSDLHELQTLQTKCERELASVDTGDPAQRKAILARLGELEGRWRSMASTTRPFGVTGHEETDELGAAYGAALAAKRKRMEEYVAERAAYERACALLPDVVLDLINRAPKLSRSPEVQNQLDEVLSRIAAGELAADPAEESKLDAALAGLKRLRGRFPLDEAAVLERLTNHIVYLQLKATAMRTARDEMHRTRLDDIGQRLFASYNTELGERSARANQLRLTVYGLTALLVAGVAYGVYRRRKSVDALDSMHSNVSELVRAKTDQLTKQNRELALEVAERRRAEIAAESARDAAAAASRTKSEFLANMSHEIRTPMTAIIGFSESLMSSDASDAERAEAITTIRRNGELLLKIIDDILDTSKIEAGKLEIVRMPFSPHEAVAEVERIMRPKAAAKDLELVVEFAGPIPRTVATDPMRLKQVLLNLVGNAVKFTERGSVKLRIESLRTQAELSAHGLAADRPASLLFTIEDTGIGMTPAQMERLFRPFAQADDSTARTFGGTGLGLAICKHLVELMGGSIALESEIGVGSKFSFTTEIGPVEEIEWIDIPTDSREAEAPSAARAGAPWPELACRVLLAEDAEDSKRLIVHVLESAGASVTAVGDGRIACERVLEAKDAGNAFDVVLMDMQMPVLDGYRAVKSLREAGYTAPIVALTASATTSERQRCVEAGCDAFCAKPIDWNALLSTIARLAPVREPRPQTIQEPVPAAVDAATPAVEPVVEPAANPTAGASVGAAVTSIFLDANEDEGFVELMRMFVDDLSNDMLSMRLALQSGEMEIIASLAHQLKGTAGSYGFPAITEQAARVEDCVRRAAAPEDVQNAIAVLQDLCMQVQTRGGKLFPGAASQTLPAA